MPRIIERIARVVAIAAGIASVVGIYCAVARVAELITGRSYLPQTGGVVH